MRSTNISLQGFWLLVDDQEYFVPFDDYPRFRDATVAQIHAIQHISAGQVCWPELDVDIEIDALARPELYPLRFQP